MLRFMLRGGLLLCATFIALTLAIKALGWFVPEGERVALFAGDVVQNVVIRELSRNLTILLASDVIGTEISFSPDGDLVFCSGSHEIFIVNRIGNDLRQLSPEGMFAAAPVWSPDGTQIAFLTTAENSLSSQLAIINRDGQEMRQFRVEVGGSSDNYPIWINDEQIFLRYSRNNRFAFRDLIINIRSGGIHDLYNEDSISPSDIYPTSGAKMMILTSSPNGREIYLVHLLENGGIEIEQTPLFTIAPAASVFDFRWSPDNSQLLFTLLDNGNYEITILDANGDLHNISRSPARDWNPAWSADGQSIAFLSNRGSVNRIYVVGVDGSNLHSITDPVVSLSDRRPVWLP
jgi:Tol biopolymer transport system component